MYWSTYALSTFGSPFDVLSSLGSAEDCRRREACQKYRNFHRATQLSPGDCSSENFRLVRGGSELYGDLAYSASTTIGLSLLFRAHSRQAQKNTSIICAEHRTRFPYALWDVTSIHARHDGLCLASRCRASQSTGSTNCVIYACGKNSHKEICERSRANGHPRQVFVELRHVEDV